jgi:hypothetical protein
MLRFLAGLSDFLRSRLNKWNSCIQYAICTFSPSVIHIMHVKLYLRHHFKQLTGTSSATSSLSWTASCTYSSTTKQHPMQLWTTFWTVLSYEYSLHNIETQPASFWTKSCIIILHYTISCTTYWASLNHMHALYHESLQAPLCKFFIHIALFLESHPETRWKHVEKHHASLETNHAQSCSLHYFAPISLTILCTVPPEPPSAPPCAISCTTWNHLLYAPWTFPTLSYTINHSLPHLCSTWTISYTTLNLTLQKLEV